MVNTQYDKAQIKGAFQQIVQLLYLKSKLFLLNNNYDQAEKCLYQALLSAEDHGLVRISKKIEEDQIKLKSEVQKWNTAYSNNYDYAKKLEMLEIESYFKDVKKMVGK